MIIKKCNNQFEIPPIHPIKPGLITIIEKAWLLLPYT